MNEIKNELLKLAIFYRDEKLTSQHIAMYAETLKHIDLQTIKFCVAEYCKDPKNSFFPVPPTKILRYAEKPKEDAHDVGVVTAARVLQAVNKFGWANSESAMNFIGPIGQNAVRVFGGWTFICENLGNTIDLTTFQAQVREIVKSNTKLVSSGSALALSEPEKRSEGLSQVNATSILNLVGRSPQ